MVDDLPEPRWLVRRARSGEAHVTPIGDVIGHDEGPEGCACGPATHPVTRPDGTVGWVVQHHSLDGREVSERVPPHG